MFFSRAHNLFSLRLMDGINYVRHGFYFVEQTLNAVTHTHTKVVGYSHNIYACLAPGSISCRQVTLGGHRV